MKKLKISIKPFLDRDEPFHSHYGGVVSQFPRNVIIDTDKATIFPLEYNPEEFNFDSVDLQQERSFYSPSTVVFMPNNTCTTNCVYCYADKTNGHRQMSFDQVKLILKSCYDLRIREFDNRWRYFCLQALERVIELHERI